MLCSSGPPAIGSNPMLEFFWRSVHGTGVVGVVLTGMAGDDVGRGETVACGGCVLAEDEPSTCGLCPKPSFHAGLACCCPAPCQASPSIASRIGDHGSEASFYSLVLILAGSAEARSASN